MVRRLKEDLRQLGQPFPERVVEPILITGLALDAPELRLAADARRLSRLVRRRRARALPVRQSPAAPVLVDRGVRPDAVDPPEDASAEAARNCRSSDAEAAGTGRRQRHHRQRHRRGARRAWRSSMQPSPMSIEMLAITRPGARPARRARRSRSSTGSRPRCSTRDHRWRDRRLILFTEWDDTRRWLVERLKEGLLQRSRNRVDLDRRILVFTGQTSLEERDRIKIAFNAPFDKEPVRILVCTDAAREGLNLQARCHDLIHVDLPWNPSRLEQRNGRIDRKLQPSKVVTCRYFFYEQREEDRVLDALVRKTETIRAPVGRVGRGAPTDDGGDADRRRHSPRRSRTAGREIRNASLPHGVSVAAARTRRRRRATHRAPEGRGGSGCSALLDARKAPGRRCGR